MTGAIIPDDWDGSTYKCYRVEWPSSEQWEAILLGALTEAAVASFWDAETGDQEDARDAVLEAYNQTVPNIYVVECDEEGEMEAIGSIKFWPDQDSPDNWHTCDGTILSKATFPDLFDVIGYDYGGSGDNFWLPDAKGRFPINTLGIGGQFEVGDIGGAKDHVLTKAEMPVHKHGVVGDENYWYSQGDIEGGSGSSVVQFNAGLTPVEMSNQGSGDEHNNMPPYFTLNLIIKISDA